MDTIDGALMMALYTSTSLAKDQIAILYYSIVLTVITIVVAIVIGTIQFLSLILNVAEPTGKFWDGVNNAGEHYEIIGDYPPISLRSTSQCFSLTKCRWFNLRLLHCIRWFERSTLQALASMDRKGSTPSTARATIAGR